MSTPAMVVPRRNLYTSEVVPVPAAQAKNQWMKIWLKSSGGVNGGVVQITVSVALAGSGPTNTLLATLGKRTPITHLPRTSRLHRVTHCGRNRRVLVLL